MAAILNFSKTLQKSHAHPQVARNVMLKFQKKVTTIFFSSLRPQKSVTRDRILARLKSFSPKRAVNKNASMYVHSKHLCTCMYIKR